MLQEAECFYPCLPGTNEVFQLQTKEIVDSTLSILSFVLVR